ncbi:MAG TPA: Mth938-like domain-containing protein [Burkholderiaceae bacterium]|nr:Mth938-like domain-containing protein [Burkholderiaceae bacterium]
MKFQPDTFAGRNAITRLDAGALWVNAMRHEGAVVVPWSGEPRAWPVAGFESLDAGHFEALLALRPELVIFGSGARHRFVAPALYRALIQARIGLEAMDTAAACRTFNVLASEGRLVVAALLPQTPA